MAEKEERILITKCSSHCHALRISCDPFDDDDGMYCDKIGRKWVRITEKDCAKCKYPVLSGISRQEAIEKISHALCTQVHGPCESCEAVAGGNENHCNDYKTYAEAALNSLLEDKK